MENEFRRKLFDFFKEAYFFQFDRREKINGRIGVLLAIFAVAANIAVRYLDELPKFDSSKVAVGFYTVLLTALILGAVTVFYMWKAIAQALTWHYLPTPEQILLVIRQIETRNKALPAQKQIDAQHVFESNLIRQFVDAATQNGVANDIKNRHVLRATQWTIATIVALIACAPSFYFLKSKVEKPTQRVEITKQIPLLK